MESLSCAGLIGLQSVQLSQISWSTSRNSKLNRKAKVGGRSHPAFHLKTFSKYPSFHYALFLNGLLFTKLPLYC